MYLHLGQNTVVRTKEILGIFDLDTTTVSAKTRGFLKKAQNEGKVISVSQELPKSFILCENGIDRTNPRLDRHRRIAYNRHIGIPFLFTFRQTQREEAGTP